MDVKFWLQTLTFKSSATTKAHIHHVCFLKMLLGVKRSTNAYCILRDRSAAPVLLLVPLCCSLLEQLIDNQQCLAKQDQ